MRHAYNHRVVIEERIEDELDPDTGALTWVWETALISSDMDLSSVPAEVLTGPGRELMAADAKQAETSARINMPWFPGLREDMRILWDGHVYDIASIETDASGRHEYRLRCVGGLSDGA